VITICLSFITSCVSKFVLVPLHTIFAVIDTCHVGRHLDNNWVCSVTIPSTVTEFKSEFSISSYNAMPRCGELSERILLMWQSVRVLICISSLVLLCQRPKNVDTTSDRVVTDDGSVRIILFRYTN